MRITAQGLRHFKQQKLIAPAKPLWYLKKSLNVQPNVYYKVCSITDAPAS